MEALQPKDLTHEDVIVLRHRFAATTETPRHLNAAVKRLAKSADKNTRRVAELAAFLSRAEDMMRGGWMMPYECAEDAGALVHLADQIREAKKARKSPERYYEDIKQVASYYSLEVLGPNKEFKSVCGLRYGRGVLHYAWL